MPKSKYLCPECGKGKPKSHRLPAGRTLIWCCNKCDHWWLYPPWDPPEEPTVWQRFVLWLKWKLIESKY